MYHYLVLQCPILLSQYKKKTPKTKQPILPKLPFDLLASPSVLFTPHSLLGSCLFPCFSVTSHLPGSFFSPVSLRFISWFSATLQLMKTRPCLEVYFSPVLLGNTYASLDYLCSYLTTIHKLSGLLGFILFVSLRPLLWLGFSPSTPHLPSIPYSSISPPPSPLLYSFSSF